MNMKKLRYMKKKTSFKFKGLSNSQLEQVRSGKIPLSFFIGFASGASLNSAFSENANAKNNENGDIKVEEVDKGKTDATEECFSLEIPTTMDFSDNVSDEMSFEQAYAVARQEVGTGGFFNWKGNSYHTLTKEEWDSLPESEQNEITAKIQENSNFEYSIIQEEEEISEGEQIDKEEDDVNQNEADKQEMEEITIDDLTIDEEDFEYVELDEIGDTEEIIAGLNDGEGEIDEYNSSTELAENDLNDLHDEFNNLNEESDFI